MYIILMDNVQLYANVAMTILTERIVVLATLLIDVHHTDGQCKLYANVAMTILTERIVVLATLLIDVHHTDGQCTIIC